MRTRVLAAVVGVVALGWGARSLGGQVQPVPGPGTGIVTVQGEVDVRRLPAIDVGQRGEWRVSLSSAADTRVLAMPAVRLAPVGFLRAGGRYLITWSGGESQTITVAQTGDGAWVRTTVSGRDLWVNLAIAKSVEEAP